MEAVLASAFFGPIQWFQKFYRYQQVSIEDSDNYQKQTYRNRCIIATPQGPLALTVPVEGFGGQKCQMKDVRISSHGSWQHQHWNALESAYGETPFFEYYADDIRPFFEKKWEFLYDYNMDITAAVLQILDLQPTYGPTREYYTPEVYKQSEASDFREVINPKHPLPDDEWQPKPYWQVYGSRHGFLPNLSILDLLFNQGPESERYLMDNG